VAVTSGPDRGLAVDSTGDEVTIGTADGSTLRLSDALVSRHHCSLTATRDGVRLRDLGSTNGTSVAGCRIESAVLAPGTTIAIGDTKVAVELLEDSIAEPVSRDNRFGDLLGTSLAMRRLFALLPKLTASDVSVLIEGETGTGKTLLARALHDGGPRAAAPFVVIDCGAIPPTLIESELFGHAKGAFTGADAARSGQFVAANGGTVFLDEIGELPLELQPKLLRVIEDRVVRAVGATTAQPVDIRIVAATNRDLRQEVNHNRFRADLWYRLATVKLTIPPLRVRSEDIPQLVAHFWDHLGGDGPPPPDLMSRLSRCPWPGNVRELRSAVERALLFDDLPGQWQALTDPDASKKADSAGELGTFRADKARATDAWERDYLAELVRRCSGNISLAARTAKMNRNHLRALLRRHGLRDSAE
jgi:DNA-binding NtrC family response regulator